MVLAAHGSRDPASSATMRELARCVGRVWPGPVVAAFLDFDEPTIADALGSLAAGPVPIVVPALLTDAFHGRVDLPAVLAAAPYASRLAPVLGPDPLLVAALRRRVLALGAGAAGADAVVLIAAGTSDGAARSTVDETAVRLGGLLGVPCRVGYASASGPTAGEAVAACRAAGARRVVVASYFLAPGRLYEAAAGSALGAGAVGVAAPLGSAAEVVSLVVARARSAPSYPGSVGAATKDAPALVPGHSPL